jgi:hypothetical protein
MKDSLYGTQLLDSILQDAFLNMHLIGPWRNARFGYHTFYLSLPEYLIRFVSTDHSVLKEHIEKIKERRVEYCDAIDMSIQTAQDGHKISRDAVTLCNYLRNKTQPQEQIQALILEMKAKAKVAHQDCKETMEMFKSVNRGLIKVRPYSDPFIHALRLIFRLRSHNKSRKKSNSSHRFITGTNLSLRWWAIKMNKVGSAGPMSPRLSSLSYYSEQIEFESAMETLVKATNGFANLAKSTNLFAEWWATVRSEISHVKKDVVALQNSEQRIGTMEKRWRLVNEHFKQYMDQVHI